MSVRDKNSDRIDHEEYHPSMKCKKRERIIMDDVIQGSTHYLFSKACLFR